MACCPNKDKLQQEIFDERMPAHQSVLAVPVNEKSQR